MASPDPSILEIVAFAFENGIEQKLASTNPPTSSQLFDIDLLPGPNLPPSHTVLHFLY